MLIFSLLIAGNIVAQVTKSKSSIKLIARSYGDSIVLRWAPSSGGKWAMYNDVGYSLSRVDYTDSKHPVTTLLTTQPIKPLTLEGMKAKLDRNNQYAAIAAQGLYGKKLSVNTQDFIKNITDQSDDLNNRYFIVMQAAEYSPPVAEAVGLRFVDKNVKKDKIYSYIITAWSPIKELVNDTSAITLGNINNGPPEAPLYFEVAAGDKKIELKWDRKANKTLSAFFIERSDDNGTSYKQLNKSPYFTSIPRDKPKDSINIKKNELLKKKHVFIDSVINYKHYKYRICGIDAFGDKSSFTKPVEVFAKDLTAPVSPFAKAIENKDNHTINISWNKDTVDHDLKEYMIAKAKAYDGPYSLLTKTNLPKWINNYIDSTPNSGSNYYVVIALDTANNYSPSVPVMAVIDDTIPPAAPTGLYGNISREGIVSLHWAKNKEDDIKGYKVYFANAATHAYTQLTINPTTDTTYYDSITLKTLTKHIYYKVVAVDKVNNHSEYSAPVELKKPDIVPPVAPVADDVNVYKNEVDIKWIQSASEDAKSYQVMRKDNNSDWKVIMETSHSKDGSFFYMKDTTAHPGIDYKYTAICIDEDGLKSEMSFAIPVRINTYEKVKVNIPLTVVYNSKNKTAELNWTFKEEGDYFFVIYKAIGAGVLQRYKSVNKDENSFKDTDMNKNETYKYALQVVYKDTRGATEIGEVKKILTKE